MAWDRLKRFLGREHENAPEIQDVSWIEAAENPWGVRVLDVRPITLGTLSMSSDQQCAVNAVSFGQEDGTSFIGEQPPVSRITKASLSFPIDRVLSDGVLFQPQEMEHKWAIFYHQGEVTCVRSWLRKVQAVGRLEFHNGYVEV